MKTPRILKGRVPKCWQSLGLIPHLNKQAPLLDS